MQKKQHRIVQKNNTKLQNETTQNNLEIPGRMTQLYQVKPPTILGRTTQWYLVEQHNNTSQNNAIISGR